ncbi:MAG: ANTAR domain-containing response regulator [Bacillota bacterium]|uniref:Stage 0 sporulation protein A homolog n=2 Tax=Carboxydocella TaxID=178898 RepID=A0A1T4RXU9_9FIRM|nr:MULTISPECIES: ANTAR domain-containing protein [Carboxydocella]AVX21391.1 response regulator receiver and ANTAR domain protein [Carboxydocella thermautotrophica]AVX31880.1 response regulator receiver and ANTAR domain protein [Carboxydocella thermautotrophica]SKA20824.1 response regulator receiver and ANTAR domain protein [Carboxydocella sporoproducens DSM 16521]
MYGVRVVLADASEKNRKELVRILSRAGYQVLGEAGDSQTALQLIRQTLPDLVVVDLNLPPAGGLELVEKLDGGRLAAMVLTGEYIQAQTLEKLKGLWVFGLILKPAGENQVLPALALAVANYQRQVELDRELDKLQRQLETRKVVDRAKGLLMKHFGLSEEEAFRRIQKQSMDKGKPMKAIAEAIILAFEVEGQ